MRRLTNQEAIEVLFNEWKCIDRNDGIHCDRKCENCDLVLPIEQIREAYNLAISALEAQEAKTQLSAEGTTSDLISRQDAIDALGEKPYIWTGCDYELGCANQYDLDKLAIETVPSAQPEHMHTVMLKIKEKYEKAMNTPCINNPIAWALYQTWKEYDR